MEDLNNNIENENVEVEKRYCADCGAEIEGDNYYTTSDGDIICVDCHDENYFFCEICNELHHNDDMIELHDTGEFVCQDCADDTCYCCDDCGEYFRESYNGIEVDGRWICEDCADDYCMCDNCGEYVHRDYINYDDDNDEYYCDSCYDELGSNEILEYHEFSNWQLFKNKSENKVPFYIGFELETVPKYGSTSHQKEALQVLKENLNVVMAHDSSLDCGGFEIISHPQSFKYIMNNRGKYKETFKKLIDLGYLSHNTDCCGLHFHITRPTNPEVIDKMWLVMETYKEQIFKLSRRGQSELNHWAQFLSDSSYNDKEKLKALYYIKKTNKSSNRYMALNNTNDKTIEFRFFRGTLNYNTFMADIEFINNLVTLCSDDNLKVTKINWDMLCKGKYISKYVEEHDIKTDKKIIDNSLQIIKLENKQKSLMNKINKILIKYAKERIKNIKIDINNINNLYDYIQKLSKFKSEISTLIDRFDTFYYMNDDFNYMNIDNYLHRLSNFIDSHRIYLKLEDIEKIEELKEELKNTIIKEVA